MTLLAIAFGLEGTNLPPQVHAWAAQQDVDRLHGDQPA